jgi:hypothetical protein
MMMSRKRLVILMLIASAATSLAEAQDYGTVRIKPKNSRIGAVPAFRSVPSLEWVRDPVTQTLGLWSPARQRFIVAFVPAPSAGLVTDMDLQDYGTAKIKPRSVRIGTIPPFRNLPTKGSFEWVHDPDSMRLGLWSQNKNRFIAVFAPAPGAVIVPPIVPMTPVTPVPQVAPAPPVPASAKSSENLDALARKGIETRVGAY